MWIMSQLEWLVPVGLYGVKVVYLQTLTLETNVGACAFRPTAVKESELRKEVMFLAK
jgi:hypothetical protein